MIRRRENFFQKENDAGYLEEKRDGKKKKYEIIDDVKSECIMNDGCISI